ncbi:MAG: hypothetical protein HZB76_02065 [Chlamydiae bacterium]|nr:hypothetical protein [Chlamydiota bacterium]
MSITNIKLIVFFLLLISCSKNETWKLDSLSQCEADFNSCKLTNNSNQISGLEVEFIQTKNELYGYLNVFFQTTTPIIDNEKKAKVTIKINDQTFEKIESRLKGGQKIALSSETTDLIITSLKNNHEVTIMLDGYETTLEPKDFANKFDNLKSKNHTLENLFHSFKTLPQ